MSATVAIYIFRHLPSGRVYAGKRDSAGAHSWARRGVGFLPDGYRGSGSIWWKHLKKHPEASEYCWRILRICSDGDWIASERRAVRLARAVFGRACLNCYAGGYGLTSDDARRLHADPEYRKKISASRRSTNNAPEFRAKLLTHLDANRAKAAAVTKRRWQDPEYRAEKIEAARRGGRAVSEDLKRRWEDPEYRAKMAAAASARSKQRWADPAHADRMRAAVSAGVSAANKKRWADPDYRARMAAIPRKKKPPKERLSRSEAAKRRYAMEWARLTSPEAVQRLWEQQQAEKK